MSGWRKLFEEERERADHLNRKVQNLTLLLVSSIGLLTLALAAYVCLCVRLSVGE